jgi:threonylcarbamoyladenosine tRNA methylthiotransferase MtaB
LVSTLSDIDGIHRVRISSIEMRQVTPRLVSLIKSGKVVPHLHIPLQSGSSKVLSDMNRPYTQDDYIRLCRDLYAEIPGIGISTDIMVGFPTETEEEFAQSVAVCEQVRYNKAHLFRFSPRYGTPADAFGDPIDPQTKIERSKALNAICSQTRKEFFARHIGHDVEVLVEEKQQKSGLLRGHTPNYLEVEFAGPQSSVGEICKVTINAADETVASGEIASKLPGSQRMTPLNVLN